MTTNPPRLAVLVSGKGSLLEAMIKDGLPIALVLADRECRALTIAQEAGLPTALVKRTDFSKRFDRDEYTRKVVTILRSCGIDWIAMAGFMTIFSQPMFDAFDGHIINTHPSLLPSFKGDRAVQDALDAGVEVTGCTIHLATIRLDDGLVLAQEEVPVLDGDTKESLHERIKEVERVLYPALLHNLLRTGVLQPQASA